MQYKILSSLKLPTFQSAPAPAGHDPIGSNQRKQEISNIFGFIRNKVASGRPHVAFRGLLVVFIGPMVASRRLMAVLEGPMVASGGPKVASGIPNLAA